MFEWSEDSDWYRELRKKLNPNTKTGTNREYTNKLINQVVDEFFPGAYHGKNAIKNFRNDMVVKSFIQHLKSVGEFDGQEKFDKVLDQFTYKKDGKRKSADHLYEDINRSWKSWINGEFEVDGVDRAQLKKELKAMADRISLSRMQMGSHYPSDIKVGKQLGYMIGDAYE